METATVALLAIPMRAVRPAVELAAGAGIEFRQTHSIGWVQCDACTGIWVARSQCQQAVPYVISMSKQSYCMGYASSLQKLVMAVMQYQNGGV